MEKGKRICQALKELRKRIASYVTSWIQLTSENRKGNLLSWMV